MLSNYDELEDILRNPDVENDLKLIKPNIENLLRKDFLPRFTQIQSWFMRCSFANKLKFIGSMFEVIQQRDSVPLWCTTIQENRFDKLSVYAETLKQHHFNYDKVVADTNRMLDVKTLKATMRNDLEWFRNLDEDFQEEIFLPLLCMGGGGLIKNFSRIMRPKPQIKPVPTESSLRDTSEFTSEHFSVKNFINTDNSHLDELDPGRELDLVVINKRKEWSHMIAKYTVAVKGKTKKEKKTSKKGKKDKKSKKSKSSKTSKSSKKSGKKGKKNKSTNEIDYIQLLPIQIVKKIFGFLDKKTLKKAKTVNPYWAYAVAGLVKDVKARKTLDKMIKKLKAVLPEDYEPPQRLCKPERTHFIHLNEASASKKIRQQLLLKGAVTQDESIMTKAIKEMAESYLVSFDGHLKTFPRQSHVGKDDKYKVLPFVLYEAGIFEKRLSQMPPISEEINVTKKLAKIDTFSPVISSLNLMNLEADAASITNEYSFERPPP